MGTWKDPNNRTGSLGQYVICMMLAFTGIKCCCALADGSNLQTSTGTSVHKDDGPEDETFISLHLHRNLIGDVMRRVLKYWWEAAMTASEPKAKGDKSEKLSSLCIPILLVVGSTHL